MDARTRIGILLIVYAVQVILAAPAWDSAIDPGYRVRRSEVKESGRILWGPLGTILGALPFLPFTVNVPDVVSGVWNFFTGFIPGSTSSGNKKPKKNSTSVTLTRQDIIDYLIYD